jgi:guanylate kinase
MASAKTGTGRLFVLSAPSGAGKTTLVHRLTEANPELCVSVSYTTRPQRKTETDGEHYYFVDPDEFRRMQTAQEFLEHAEVFDNQYGTSRNQVEDHLHRGDNVILEIDWQGAEQVRENMPECCTIFILPPSVDVLEQRLTGRDTDTPAVIQRRLRDAVADISHWKGFDYAVINDDLDVALSALQSIIDGAGSENRTSDSSMRQCVEELFS